MLTTDLTAELAICTVYERGPCLATALVTHPCHVHLTDSNEAMIQSDEVVLRFSCGAAALSSSSSHAPNQVKL